MDGGYPFGDLGKLFEQNGWMKAELQQKATKADLVQLEASLKDYARELEDKRIASMKAALTEWWLHEEPRMLAKMREAIEDDRKEQARRREQVLAEQGMELGPDGKAKSKINPVVSTVKQNWIVLPVVLAVLALTRPEWFGYAWAFTMRAVF